MEKNNDHWVEERLATLQPSSDWQPDASKGLARLQERRGRRRRWTWAAATATAACLGAMALPETRVLAERCVGACSEAGIRLWRSLSAADHKIAPDFTLNDASGQPVKLSDFRGKVVLLNFWATWCPPCKVEIPWFAEFQQTYKNRDFVVLGVSLDEDGWKSVQPFLDAPYVRVYNHGGGGWGGDHLSIRVDGRPVLDHQSLLPRIGYHKRWWHRVLQQERMDPAEVLGGQTPGPSKG